MSLLLLQCPPLLFPSLPISRRSHITLVLKPLPHSSRRRPTTALHVSDPDLLHSLTAGAPSSSDHLPAVRTYESDLASLTLVGSVALEQALTAAAADGGEAAEEHLANGMDTMVVETVFPGATDESSTVSTRLFLPAKKVKVKAKKLRSSLTADILSSSNSVSRNILAMTFRQVVLQTLWSFKLSMFSPGTERNMEDVANPREVLEYFSISSSDQRLLSKLAEVVCSCALESNKMFYLQRMGDFPSSSTFSSFQKPQSSSLIDSSICIHKVPQAEVIKYARQQLQKFKLVKGKSLRSERKWKHCWWEPPNNLGLDKFGGPGFSKWVHEFVPAYSLQVNVNMFEGAKLEGCKQLSNNRWEVLLTHFQMVELANILDMYYEDQYTLPNKELSCALVTKSPVISIKKNSPWKLLIFSLAGGCILVFVSILAQIYRPNPLQSRIVAKQNRSPLSETYNPHLKPLEAAELEAFCTSILKKIKDELGWPGEIVIEKNLGVWTGALPSYLRELDDVLNPISSEEESSSAVDPHHHSKLISDVSTSGSSNLPMPTTAQDIATYQVVLSGDGKVVGFQPTSRVAVNQWATNPLAKVLYGGRKLSPGLLEPSLKIPRPSEVILIELLMSVKPESQFALARPMQ